MTDFKIPRLFVTIAVGAMLVAGTNVFAEPVTVLGLPLGGKLQASIRQCAIGELDTDVRSLCWVDAPSIINGARSGMLSVPGSDLRPAWAAYATFEVWVEKDGTLSSFTARNLMADRFTEIQDSISGRYGKPHRQSNPGPTIMASEWTAKEGSVRLLCADGSGCNARFTSATAHTKHFRDLASRQAKDAARPATP